MRKIFFLLCSLWVIQSHAEVALVEGKISIQQVSRPELDVFCNQKDAPVIVNRVEFANDNQNGPGVQAGWSSSLPPHMCSIFLTDKSPFTFACSQEASGAFHAINCQEVLLASRLPWSGQTLDHQAISGSYWIVENATPDELIILLHHKNIDT